MIYAISLNACAWQDVEQQRICERLIPWFERSTAPVGPIRAEFPDQLPNTLILIYQAADGQHWLRCRFGGGGFSRQRLLLTAVESDREGGLAPWQLAMLRSLWLDYFEPQLRSGRETSQDSLWRAGLYLLQQILNALPLGCIYALVACGYTLVFALIGRVNLAFGELATWGAFAAVLGLPLLAPLLGAPLLLLMALIVGVLGGWLLERLSYRPFAARLVDSSQQAPLVVSVGLIIAAEEYARLVFGSRDLYLQPVLSQPIRIAYAEGFTVSFSLMQLTTVVVTLVLFAMLLLLLHNSHFGRLQRACADDAGAAELLGVDTNRVVLRTFQLGSAYAASAGVIMALYYGVVNFHMGLGVSLKGLAAVIVGGIGSVPGAFLGGLLIAMLETLWSAYASIAYRDVAVFAMLIGFLVLRPQGLLGLPDLQRNRV